MQVFHLAAEAGVEFGYLGFELVILGQDFVYLLHIAQQGLDGFVGGLEAGLGVFGELPDFLGYN